MQMLQHTCFNTRMEIKSEIPEIALNNLSNAHISSWYHIHAHVLPCTRHH